MIKSRLHILMGERKIKSIRQLSEETKVSRLALTKLYDGVGKGIEWTTLETLCKHFKCNVGDILTYEELE